MVKLVHFILLITDGKVDQSPTPTPPSHIFITLEAVTDYYFVICYLI